MEIPTLYINYEPFLSVTKCPRPSANVWRLRNTDAKVVTWFNFLLTLPFKNAKTVIQPTPTPPTTEKEKGNTKSNLKFKDRFALRSDRSWSLFAFTDTRGYSISKIKTFLSQNCRPFINTVSNARSLKNSSVIIHFKRIFLFHIWPKVIFSPLGITRHQDSDLTDLEKQIRQLKRSKLLRVNKQKSTDLHRNPPGSSGRQRSRPGRGAEFFEEISI